MDSRVGARVSAFNISKARISKASGTVVTNCKLSLRTASFMMGFTLFRLTLGRGGRRLAAARNHKMLCLVTGG